jgi:glycosyltransferase involved in cell wall biosynthesis
VAVNPTTVLMTTDATGGVWTYSIALARGLAAKGVGVVLATMGPRPSPAQRRTACSIPGLILEQSDYALEWMDWPWAEMEAAGEWLLELELRHGPDVIHLNSYGHADLPFRAPVVLTAHACACGWWRAVYRAEAPALYDRYRELVRKGFEGASAVVAPTIAAWELIEREHGGHDVVYVVPHGLRSETPLRDPKLPFFLAAARRWDEAKNVELLRKAAGDLLWPVRIAGDTEETTSVRPASKLGWLGDLERPHLLRWMRSASVFVHPAKYEPFGLTALEAALSGCALVLADLPTLREVWGGTALYFSPDSPLELARKANVLAEQPDLRKSMAGRALEHAQLFSVDFMTDAYLGIYRQVSALSRRPRALSPTA